MHYSRCFLAVVTLLVMQPLQAAVESGAVSAASRPTYSEPFNGGSMMQLLAGLILVVALILLLAWFVRRYTGLPGQYRGLRVIASVSLSPREKLVLVQAGEKQLLLGVAPGQVSLIEHCETPLIDQSQAAGDFASKLQQVLSRTSAE